MSSLRMPPAPALIGAGVMHDAGSIGSWRLRASRPVERCLAGRRMFTFGARPLAVAQMPSVAWVQPHPSLAVLHGSQAGKPADVN